MDHIATLAREVSRLHVFATMATSGDVEPSLSPRYVDASFLPEARVLTEEQMKTRKTAVEIVKQTAVAAEAAMLQAEKEGESKATIDELKERAMKLKEDAEEAVKADEEETRCLTGLAFDEDAGFIGFK